MATFGRPFVKSLCKLCVSAHRPVFKLNANICKTTIKYQVINNLSPNRRTFHTNAGPLCSEVEEFVWKDAASEDEIVNIVYVNKEGHRVPIKGKVGDNVMYLAHRYNIEVEGACEASLACCTCHVYVNDGYFDKLDDPEEKEEDMLDMAPFLKPNSRLSCCITLQKDLDGIEVTLPLATRNFYVDGHVPEPH